MILVLSLSTCPALSINVSIETCGEEMRPGSPVPRSLEFLEQIETPDTPTITGFGRRGFGVSLCIALLLMLQSDPPHVSDPSSHGGNRFRLPPLGQCPFELVHATAT